MFIHLRRKRKKNVSNAMLAQSADPEEAAMYIWIYTVCKINVSFKSSLEGLHLGKQDIFPFVKMADKHGSVPIHIKRRNKGKTRIMSPALRVVFLEPSAPWFYTYIQSAWSVNCLSYLIVFVFVFSSLNEVF